MYGLSVEERSDLDLAILAINSKKSSTFRSWILNLFRLFSKKQKA